MADAQHAARIRKLRPIYDAMDAGNYKQALKHCEKKNVAKMVLVVVRAATRAPPYRRRADCGPNCL